MGSLSGHMQRIKNSDSKESENGKHSKLNDGNVQLLKKMKSSKKNQQEKNVKISEIVTANPVIPQMIDISKDSDPILEVCFSLNSSFGKLYSNGYIDYKQLIHFSIIHCFENEIKDEYVIKMLKLGLTNIREGGKNLFKDNPFM